MLLQLVKYHGCSATLKGEKHPLLLHSTDYISFMKFWARDGEWLRKKTQKNKTKTKKTKQKKNK